MPLIGEQRLDLEKVKTAEIERGAVYHTGKVGGHLPVPGIRDPFKCAYCKHSIDQHESVAELIAFRRWTDQIAEEGWEHRRALNAVNPGIELIPDAHRRAPTRLEKIKKQLSWRLQAWQIIPVQSPGHGLD